MTDELFKDLDYKIAEGVPVSQKLRNAYWKEVGRRHRQFVRMNY